MDSIFLTISKPSKISLVINYHILCYEIDYYLLQSNSLKMLLNELSLSHQLHQHLYNHMLQ